jgi:hypothetical protein
MNFVFGANVRDGRAFAHGVATGLTAAGATTGVDPDVPGVESSAHPSPIAPPPRITAQSQVCFVLISFSLPGWSTSTNRPVDVERK